MRLIDADRLKAVLANMRLHIEQDKTTMADTLSTFLSYAMEVVDNQPTIAPPPNDPLTLAELRGMDGDKIHVHYIDCIYTDEDGAYFGKFEQLVRECNEKLTACELPLEYYGKTWLAYRRKPEEGTS